MHAWLWGVPLLPFAGSMILFASLGRMPVRWVSLIGVGSIGLSAAFALAVAAVYLPNLANQPAFETSLGTWMAVGSFRAAFTLRLDSLSMLMILVITVVAFLIHLYSTVYMAGDTGYCRFFAYMNLFTASMLILVLGAGLLLLFLGWEGVGLCSYLLIGFWYQDPYNGYAARKAFVVTRVGDAAMLMGLILLATSFGTLNIQEILARAPNEWQTGSGIAIAAASLLAAGAVGKSAQLPLQTWLPDAMAGPTPVSALLHAATMVTAGMYLIARTNELFVIAPAVQLGVAAVGALTLLLAAFSALGQDDIKRVLAYSTMSQIGYMFLALGVGASRAAVFHFMTHAFFKALLFLSAGVVILGSHHEQNIFNMGGLRKRLPAAFWSFLAGAAALAAVPVISSGFYSKEQILLAAWESGPGGRWLWAAGIAAAFITAVYIFRVVFIVFFGPEASRVPRSSEETGTAPGGGAAPGAQPEGRLEHAGPPHFGYAVLIPLGLLSVLAIGGGFVGTPAGLGHVTVLSRFLGTTLPAASAAEEAHGAGLEIAAAAASLGGILVSYLLYFPGRAPARPAPEQSWAGRLRRVWASGWEFDLVYDLLFVKPFMSAAAFLRTDLLDWLSRGLAFIVRVGWQFGRLSQTGELRWYAAGMLAGLVILIGVAMFV